MALANDLAQEFSRSSLEQIQNGARNSADILTSYELEGGEVFANLADALEAFLRFQDGK